MSQIVAGINTSGGRFLTSNDTTSSHDHTTTTATSRKRPEASNECMNRIKTNHIESN